MNFLLFARTMSNKYGKQLLNTVTKKVDLRWTKN